MKNMDLSKKTKTELFADCEALSIQKYKSKSKPELIQLIQNASNKHKHVEEQDQEENVIVSSTSISSSNHDSTNIIESNAYYIGDNLDLLHSLMDKSIHFIYFDPPYNTGRNFYDFDDKFTSKEDYIQFIKARIAECHRVLVDEGTIVIHIEPKISHYFRCICDDRTNW